MINSNSNIEESLNTKNKEDLLLLNNIALISRSKLKTQFLVYKIDLVYINKNTINLSIIFN